MDGIEIQKLLNCINYGIVDTMGTCKQSLLAFYGSQSFNAKFITNSVDANISPRKKRMSENKRHIKIGLYAARCSDWRKNMYSQIATVSQMENVVLDIIPLEYSAKEFAKLLNIKVTGENKNLSREELMKRMSNNDVNLYVSFSECAPMIPLESLEMGIPCVIGNNCHYFKETELEDFLVVNNETNILQIKEKIEKVLDNYDYIMDLYKKFKEQNTKQKEIQISKYMKD